MSKPEPPIPVHASTLQKSATGITGLDEITGGSLPRGRPTLVCGGQGSGTTMLAMEFLVRGATQFGEPASTSRREWKRACSGSTARARRCTGLSSTVMASRPGAVAVDPISNLTI